MLSVVINWLYVTLTSYILGFGVLNLIAQIPCMYTAKGSHKNVYSYKYNESFLMAGILTAGVYAEIFSIFGGVGLTANVILCLACAFLAYKFREELRENLTAVISNVEASGSFWLYLIIFLLMAYGTSHGLMHYDTDLYHAQAIRWIEKYGAVKGLANLHVRLGYNSASFALSALYSTSFLGKSMHAMAGYFALLLAWQCADLKCIAKRCHPVLSDFVRIIALYYLFTIYDEMVSPASDYFMTTLVFYIFIHWIDLYVMHERAFLPHALLAMLAVYATTIKLSAAPLVLLAAYPIYRVVKKRKKEGIKPVLICTGICLVISLPYFIRNVIQTGWLIYPFTGIDIFTVLWKVPKSIAINDAHEITAYGRGFTSLADYSVPFTEWFPMWYEKLGLFNKIMFVGDIISLVIFIGCVIYYLAVVMQNRDDKKEEKKEERGRIFRLSNRKAVSLSDFIFIELIAYVALVYFIATSPLIRYGCVYLWLPVTILCGRFIIMLYNKLGLAGSERTGRLLALLILFFILYKGVNLVVEDIPRFSGKYLERQQEYNTYNLAEKKINGISFYYPESGDRTGYDPFPSAPNLDGFRMLGGTLKSGFIPAGTGMEK